MAMEIEEVAIDIDTPLETTAERNYDVSGAGAGEERCTLMKKKLNELPGKAFEGRHVTIFRLPPLFNEINKELCEPRMVSIGPYHHGKKNLRTMEEHKWFVLRDFLERNKDVDLEVYFEAMRSIEKLARQCYSETLDMGSDEFVMMLLLDGCFILEWFLKFDDSCQVDAICDVGWGSIYLFSDFLLLENQLPFLVIRKLFVIQDQGMKFNENCEDDCSLLELLVNALNLICADLWVKLSTEMLCSRGNNIDHLLHLIYIGVMTDIQPQPQRKQGNSVIGKLYNFCGPENFPWSKFHSKPNRAVSDQGSVPFLHQNIPCISELHDAGVKFKIKKKPHNMFDISFKNGTIVMPILKLDPLIARIILNMVAFEQILCTQGSPQILSSYLALMDSLINTQKDVTLLERSGIAENYFENAKEMAAFCNQFGRVFGLDYSDHYFDWLYKEVKEYSKSSWHAYRARLMHDYFSNPWSIISLVAAAILLILTFIQTYYSATK